MFKFPSGEVHPKLKLSPINTRIAFFNIGEDSKFNMSDHIMEILLSASYNKGTRYFIPYLPFSRQDRDTHDGGPFSLKAFGDMLNIFQLKEVVTMDVHSDVAFACINNLKNISIEEILDKYNILRDYHNRVLVIPDAGAYKKLSKLDFHDQVIGKKSRNTETGRLEFKGIDGNVKDKECIIVDDICDGGATFIALTKELYSAGAKSVDLFVTHGIFTKGEQILFDCGIRKIYTTNSFYQKPMENKVVFNCLEFFK